MLVEVIFGIHNDDVHKMLQTSCIDKIYELIDSYMANLNSEIQQLNASLKQDQLQLAWENPLVNSIMQKIDLLTSFIRMIFRVFEKITKKNASFSEIYY